MNTKKQYTKPNCTLTVEGFDEDAATLEDDSSYQEPRISILTGAECYFTSSNQRISGGRTFIDNLAHAVNSYAQEILSGISHPQDNQEEYPQVQITQIDASQLHCLTLKPDPTEEQTPQQEISLKTTELFDLVEVVDQFYADETALPDVSLELEVIGKRFRQTEEPIAQRVFPFVAGAVSLAVAAGLFFVLPVPEVPEPEPALENVPVEQIPVTPEAAPPETAPTETDEESEEAQ